MATMENQTNQTKQNNPGSRSDGSQVRSDGHVDSKRDLEQTSDEMATATQRNFDANQADENTDSQNQNDQKKYDESDPNWVEPDVQMQRDAVNPELEANIGPQS